MSRRWQCVVSLVLLMACAEAPPPPPDAENDGPAAPSDSLVLTAPGGVTVWLTVTRSATGPDGATCEERALEVRTDSTRRGVPLLYTREAPTLLGTDAMRAVLYNGCVAGAAYRVDFATVSPERLGR